ncbi:radical SAM/SPASM domain-containing protein [Butyrivibrio sp. JL13D10]|uniref:radical SAM protein n=1 Tax=Butyrivibrio sp. JL13D10 TaxID=3236815 RepID=UPI0038B4FC96
MIKYTELKNNNRHNLMDVLPLSKPYTVLIEPSNYCNFRCISCFQSLNESNYLTQNRGMMSLEMFISIIEQLSEWEGDKIKVLKISLYGEPLTNPNFCAMLRIAKEANIADRIETTTNASLITEDIAEQLVKYEIDYIRVSIYGGNQERYKEVTGCENVDINKIEENLKTIQRIKKMNNAERPFVSAKMLDTYSDENEQFLERFGPVVDEVYIDKPHNWIATEEKSFIGSLYKEDQRDELDKDLKKTRKQRIACPMPFTTIAIRSNGEVSPCCVDWIGGTNLGNIQIDTLKNIWNGDAMYEFRKMQLENRRKENSSCRNCELADNDYYTRDNIDGFPVSRLR